MLRTKILQRLWLLLLILTAGGSEAWGYTGNAVVKMTYVDYNNPTTSYGEIPTGETAKAGYNSIGKKDGFDYVNFGNTGWNCNWLTFIQVDASAIPGRITNATLTADISGSTDNKRTTNWGVGYNYETWSSAWTFNSADRHLIKVGSEVWSTSSNSGTFNNVSFDITNALKNDIDHKVNLVVYELQAAGGYIKNPAVTVTYDAGWSVEEYTVSLTNVDKDNKITTGMPMLYNPSGSAVTYSYSGAAANYDRTYPPRLKQTGDAIVTATIGGTDYTYTLHVTSPTGGGTYDDNTNTYTFDQIGVIEQRSFTDVEGVTMSINGGPTALVVQSGDYKVLKVIDGNGYSHPNLNANHIPYEGNYGGTFYKFVTSLSGTLYITGVAANDCLYRSDGTAIADGSSYVNSFHLDEGQTYYLYKANYNNDGLGDLLQSYRFVPDDSGGSLKFKNPSSTISVDLSEGSYTNEAVSGLGLPVTYSILAGGSYATINANTGKVMFKKSELLNQNFPLTITVKAQTAAWGGNPAAATAYNILLTKSSWIFDDDDLWSTSGSDFSSIWGDRTNYKHHNGDGTYHYQLTTQLTNAALTKDGVNELPETKGLKFSTDASSNRLEIAPHGESPNYLAALNTTISVENVKAGQTVTVDWYAARSTARLTMTDAADVSTGELSQGISTLTATADGTVRLTFNATISYVRSIKISTPIRATGTLTYAKTIMNPGETENRTGYTIVNEETDTDIKDVYHGPGNFKSSNTGVATVDASGNVTAVAVGTAFITATASPLNSQTHQTATLTTMIEVINPYALSSANTRTRTLNIEKMLYEVGIDGKSANDGLDRTVPGFTLTFSGGQGVKCNNEERLTLRNKDGSEGVMTISTRTAEGKAAWIGKVRLTVSNLQDSPKVKYVDLGEEKTVDVIDGVLELGGIYNPTMNIQASQGSFDISDIKIYYCSDESTIDNCLDETKVAPSFSFATQHYMRVPGDGRAFQNDKPTSSDPRNFRASEFTYTSSNTSIATIGRDGTGGRLISSGEATITATFDETDYFAQSTATYTVSNTLLPGESYDGLAMTTGQFIHVTAQASADNTTLTMENAATNLTYGTTRERRNSYVNSTTSVNLKNQTSERITVYSVDIITSNVKAWLYYEGQEENFSAQVQFTGFPTGPIAGFKVVDFGDINNPIDITDAYSYKDGSTFAIEAMPDYALLDNPGGTLPGGTTWYSGTGDTYAVSPGTTEIRRMLTKTGSADGYPDDNLKAISTVTVMQFDADHPVVWNFQDQLDNTGVSGQMGSQWSYTNPGTGRDKYYQTYFDSYMPILKNGDVAKDNNVGVLVYGDMRYYGGTPGLRLNLTKANAHMKFPVKENMEVVITLATSAADVTNIVHNVKSVKPPYNTTNTLYVEREGVNSPINGYFLAASDGAVTLDASDKVGVYIKSIRLQVPELHFEDEIVTELTGSGWRTVNYKPYNAVEGHTLSYWVKDNKNYNLNDVEDGTWVANISDEQRHSGDVSLVGNEGWVTIYVEDPSATGVQPKKGEYKLYVVNFHFDPTTDAITLDANGEAVFTRRPVGYDKVKTPIDYTMTLGTGNPRGRIIQYTNESPALTTYRMTAYSTGTITVTATSGNATTSCVITVSGQSFGDVAPVMSESELAAAGNTFTNPWPSGWSSSDSYTFDVSKCAYGDAVTCNTPTATASGLQLTGLGGHGAIRVIVYNNTRSETARFVLTLSYPASSRKKWSFFRAKDHNSQWGLEIGEIDSYNDYNNKKSNVSKTVNGYNGTNGGDPWTTSSTWSQIFRKGAELPRWGNDRSMKGDNAFYVQETAGLQIETGNQGFYVDQPARDPSNKYAYNHVGIHNNASITIPKLKEGDFVSLNLSRVIPNNGAILTGYNVSDLRGKPVTEQFTITRSQTEWEALNSDGSRFIPGYYTFIAHDMRANDDPDKIAHPNEFDVTFELLDEGYLDVLSIEIYDGGIYKHTMTEIKLKDQETMAPNLLLKDEDEELDILLSYCHPLWSTSTGPCEYVFKGEQPDVIEDYSEANKTECRYWVNSALTQRLKDGRKNLNMTLEHVKWFSAGGVEYEDGLLTVKRGYGKVVLRMNNYTVEGRYLIGYTPDYTLNVGVKPHQDYPYTWNFTSISNGEVQGLADNVYNSIKDDSPNWIKIANVNDVYQLNTDSKGASLYVPGGELVSTNRILGARGENRITGRGFDELNGLGVNGKILFSINTTSSAARQTAKSPKRAAGDANDLLTYSVTSTSTAVGSDISAGNGYIYFGANNFESCTTDKSATGYTYKCNAGSYVLLKPQRAFAAGDVIQIKAWSENGNGGLAFWTNQTNVGGATNIVSLSLTKTNEEDVLEYTVTVGDGIEGLSQIYVYNNGLTSYLNSVTITRSTVPVGMTHNLYTASETTLTIPDLNADGKQDWIYISADTEPTAITNATKVYENGDNDGPDARTGIYKYKVTSPGNADVTFAEGTNIYQIGVTHILKDIHEVGGIGWATESRRHAIDHTLTGYFTVNDANAHTVSYDSYDLKTATVALQRVAENVGVPAKTGVVLKVDDASNLGKANLNTTNNLRRVPLFYPAVSTSVIPYDDIKFKTDGNMMMANLETRMLTKEADNGTLDDNEDAVDDTGDDNGDYNRFMLTNVHWKYVVHDNTKTWETIDNADAAGFHRLHIWKTSDPGVSYTQTRCDELNTMAANTAYLLVPTSQLPTALWTALPPSSSRRNSLGIREFDFSDPTSIPEVPAVSPADAEASEGAALYHSLDGRRVSTPKKGLYIKNGRKVVIK